MPRSRRSLLRAAGAVAGLAAAAGCVSIGSTDRFVLHTGDVDGTLADRFLVDRPTEVRADTRVDFDPARKRDWIADLFETGTVRAVQWPLVAQEPWGEDTHSRPTFLYRDEAYHEVTVERTRQVDRERWLFAVERVDEDPPTDATVGREPFDSLSERDRTVLDAALDAVYAGNDGFLGEPDIDGLRPVHYHQGLSAEASELVPEPPFEYVEYGEETFRVVVDRRTVTVPEYTFAVERVAASRDALEAYVRETVPDARFEAPSDAVRNVLDDAVGEGDGGPRYEEDPPLSDPLATILDELGIGDDLEPFDAYEERADFQGAVAAYDGDWYVFNLFVDAG